MIDGLKASIVGAELKEVLYNRASNLRALCLLTNSKEQLEAAAFLSFLGDHVEDDETYRIPFDQVLKFGLHLERTE